MDDKISSKAEPPEIEPVYYYSREHRLQRASQKVRDFNASFGKKPPNVFATLTSTRSNTLLLITIMIMCVFIAIMNKITRQLSTYNLAGTVISAQAQRSGNSTYIEISKTGSAYKGAVSIACAARSKPDAPQIQTVFFTADEKETFYLSFPFQDSQILLLLQTDTEEQVNMVLTCK